MIKRSQPERRHIGLEMADGMRIEGRDDNRKIVIMRMMHGAADNRLMPEYKNTSDWKAYIGKIEQQAVDGILNEKSLGCTGTSIVPRCLYSVFQV